MNRRLTLGIALSTLFVARLALAQEVRIGYQGLPYKYSGDVHNTGIQVSDGVLMHVGAGAEAGYDSNVFYADSATQATVPSGIIRVTAYTEVTNATRAGTTPSGLFFDARAGLQYRRYTSSDVNSQVANSFMPSAGLSLGTGVATTFSFGLTDTFVRSEDAPYSAGLGPIIRDNNQASAELRFAPGGGRINTLLRYTNVVDIFETNSGAANYSYADSVTHELMLDGSWKWLPKTALFFQARQGYVTYLKTTPNPGMMGSAPPKYSSYPLHLILGLRGLITEKISAVASAGYANAFYSCPSGALACVSTGGFAGSLYANAELTYRPTLLGRVVLGYRHDFNNAVISTFYYGDQVYASYVQQVAERFALDLSGRYFHKNYQGYVATGAATSPRVDNVFEVGATFDYFLRDWAYAGVGYALITNSSDPSTIPSAMGAPNSLNYTKHQVFARLGVTY
jgi:hypothetical protein